MKVPMILKTLLNCLIELGFWRLLKGGVEKVKGESMKKKKIIKKGRRPYCPFVNAEKDLRASGFVRMVITKGE